MSKRSTKTYQNNDDDYKMMIDSSSVPPNASTSQKPDASFNSQRTPVKTDSSDCGDGKDCIKIICISDTHNGHNVSEFARKIEQMQGDILIHAGDFGENGSDDEIESAFKWLCSLDNFKFKIFISGNMDGIGLQKLKLGQIEQKRRKLFSKDKNVIYLENDECEVLGIKIYGCPYTPKFFGGFQYHRQSKEAEKLWAKIPEDCDILVSHGPPVNILDQSSKGVHVGCHDLLEAIWKRQSLRAIVFGHVHHSYGFEQQNDKWFINAAQYNGIYHQDAQNKPFEILMRRRDKTILHVKPNQPSMHTTRERSNIKKPYGSDSRYYTGGYSDTTH